MVASAVGQSMQYGGAARRGRGRGGARPSGWDCVSARGRFLARLPRGKVSASEDCSHLLAAIKLVLNDHKRLVSHTINISVYDIPIKSADIFAGSGHYPAKSVTKHYRNKNPHARIDEVKLVIL